LTLNVCWTQERWAAAEKEFFKDQKLIEWARMGGEL